MMTLQEKLRSGHVRRWHIVAVSREQTVADHMHRVGVIAEEILRILGLFDWNNNITLNTMRYAAIHDRHEYLLGDIPTPGKEAIYAQRLNAEDLVEKAARKLDPEYEELHLCLLNDCPIARWVITYADQLEALNYLGIFGVGSHACAVWHDLRDRTALACDTLAHEVGATTDQRTRLYDLRRKLQEGLHWT